MLFTKQLLCEAHNNGILKIRNYITTDIGESIFKRGTAINRDLEKHRMIMRR